PPKAKKPEPSASSSPFSCGLPARFCRRARRNWDWLPQPLLPQPIAPSSYTHGHTEIRPIAPRAARADVNAGLVDTQRVWLYFLPFASQKGALAALSLSQSLQAASARRRISPPETV